MKLGFILFTICMLGFWITQASNTCEIHSPVSTGYEIEIKFNVNLRWGPCVTDWNITWWAKEWEKYITIRKVEGFYEIQNKNWVKFWIWDQAIDETHKYILTVNDQKIIDLIINKIDKLITKNWEKSQILFTNLISNILNTTQISQRERVVFMSLENILEQKYNNNNNNVDEAINEWDIVEETENHEIINDRIYDWLVSVNINYSSVKSYWLELYNDARDSRGIYSYNYSSTLEKSAFNWSEVQKVNSHATHKRDPNDEYYDYKKITSWLWENNIVCKNSSWYTHTENVWWWTFTCNDWECSEELNEWIKRTFDFFMKEEFEEYKLHYLSVVNEYFKEIWLWIAVQETKDNHYEFYLTVHYCTELEK
jgi:hypothetical protein